MTSGVEYNVWITGAASTRVGVLFTDIWIGAIGAVGSVGCNVTTEDFGAVGNVVLATSAVVSGNAPYIR
jgi:hypothetical protein